LPVLDRLGMNLLCHHSWRSSNPNISEAATQ
jgi:hypothetical protein